MIKASGPFFRRIVLGLLRGVAVLTAGTCWVLAIDAYFTEGLGSDIAMVRAGALCLGGALLVLMQHLLVRSFRRYWALRSEVEQETTDHEGLLSQIRNLERERLTLHQKCTDLQQRVEHFSGAHALSKAAHAHDSLEDLVQELVHAAHDIAEMRTFTIYLLDDDLPVPVTHFDIDQHHELSLSFTTEGRRHMAQALEAGPLEMKRIGVRRVRVNFQGAMGVVITADLGLTVLPSRTREQVGSGRLVLRDMLDDMDPTSAGEWIKSAIARTWIDATNVAEALSTSFPQDLDSRRSILEIACPIASATEKIGIIKAAFNTYGVDIEARISHWERVLHDTSRHLATAMRSDRFHERAIKDGMTGLFNKSYLLENLQSSFVHAQKTGERLSFVMADIDHFKSVNDTYGHPTGDIILKNVAQAFSENARASDIPFRYGGEEMGFLMIGADKRAAKNLAERVRKCVEAMVHTGEKGETIRCTISLGIAELAPDMHTAESLMSAADEALYYSKENGRNQSTVAGSREMRARTE